LYRTLDRLLAAQEPIENDLKTRFGTEWHEDNAILDAAWSTSVGPD
jgi:hypothetical protein